MLTKDQEPKKVPLTIRLRWKLERVFGIFMYWLARRMSRKRSLSLANRLGEIFVRLFPRYRMVCIDGVTIAFGNEYSPGEIRRIAKASQINLMRTVMDFLRFGLYSKEELLALGPVVKGKEHMENAIAKSPGGVIGLTAHLGSWEYCGAWVVASGWRVSAVGKEQRDPGITRIMLEQRAAAGIKHIPRTKRGQMEIVRALKTKGTVLGLISDQNGGKDGVFVDFFGVPASSVKGPAALALRYGVPVVPMFTLWDGDLYKVEIQPELELIRSGDEEADILENTGRFQKVIEEMVRRYPEQWLWAHRRWKTRPPGEPPIHKH